MADVDSTLGESQHTLAQFHKDLEIERLRLENRRLREEIARSKSQASSTIFPSPPASIPGGVTRQVLNEEERPPKDFLKLGTPEFKGETIMVRQVEHSIVPNQHKNKRKRGRFRGAPANPTPTVSATYRVGQEIQTQIQVQTKSACATCRKRHSGQCRREISCYRYGQPGHMGRWCANTPIHQATILANPTPTVSVTYGAGQAVQAQTQTRLACAICEKFHPG